MYRTETQFIYNAAGDEISVCVWATTSVPPLPTYGLGLSLCAQGLGIDSAHIPTLLAAVEAHACAPRSLAELHTGLGSMLLLSALSLPPATAEFLAAEGYAGLVFTLMEELPGADLPEGNRAQVLLLSGEEVEEALKHGHLRPLLARGLASNHYPCPPWNLFSSQPSQPPASAAGSSASSASSGSLLEMNAMPLAEMLEVLGLDEGTELPDPIQVPLLRVRVEDDVTQATVLIPRESHELIAEGLERCGMMGENGPLALAATFDYESPRHVAVVPDQGPVVFEAEVGEEEVGTSTGLSSIVFIPNAPQDAVHVWNDALLVSLSPGSWMVFFQVLLSGTTLKIQSDVEGGLELGFEYVEPKTFAERAPGFQQPDEAAASEASAASAASAASVKAERSEDL